MSAIGRAPQASSFLELSFDLESLDPTRAEDAAVDLGAAAVTFVDARDDPVLEPAPGELRLWPMTRVRCLFAAARDPQQLQQALAAALGVDAALVSAREVADRVWEREWLKDFHALRFGTRLWVCPQHERVADPSAVVVHLDPGLAFGTGTHPSTALCLTWIDQHLVPGARVIDYGCGSGILGLAAAKLGAAEVHAFDIDPQALIATAENGRANGVAMRLELHETPTTLPRGVDLLMANILSGPLCTLSRDFAGMVRTHGQILLGGLMEHETADVTEAYAPCFDVARVADRDGWVCLAGRRR